MSTTGLIEITGTVQKQSWLNKVLPPVERVAEHVLSIPVVFHNNPMRYTLCYALFNDSECLIIDPGNASDEGFEQIAAGLKCVGLGISDVTGVLATHFHTDHLGLAKRVAQAAGAWVAMGELERRYISDFTDAREEAQADQRRMAGWGVPADRRAEAAMSQRALLSMKDLADPDIRLTDGQEFIIAGRTLRIASTPGHTPGHICLWDDEAEMVFSGDHVLPRISPNVSLESRGDADPLRSNLESLTRIAENDHYEVAPAHEYRFRGIASRSRALTEHIHERSAEVLSALDRGADSVYAVARQLSWSRGWDSLHNLQFRLALSETAAHIQYLMTSKTHPGVPGLPASR